MAPHPFNPQLIEHPQSGLCYDDGRVLGAIDVVDDCLVISEWTSRITSQGHTVVALQWLRAQGFSRIVANGVGTVDHGVGDIATVYWTHMLDRGLVDALIDDEGADITNWARAQTAELAAPVGPSHH